MAVAVNAFVRRQLGTLGVASRFSHTTLSDDELAARVEAALPAGVVGYREGVLLVPVAPEGFFVGGSAKWEPGMVLRALYEPRRPDEEPRLTVGCVAPEGYQKPPARVVEVVLYASTVLAEDGHNELPAVPGNWEIISLNAREVEGEEPIHPDTLIANHFGKSGGTATNMTPEQFVVALQKSVDYWWGRFSLLA